MVGTGGCSILLCFRPTATTSAKTQRLTPPSQGARHLPRKHRVPPAPASVQNAASQADFPFGSPDVPANRLYSQAKAAPISAPLTNP